MKSDNSSPVGKQFLTLLLFLGWLGIDAEGAGTQTESASESSEVVSPAGAQPPAADQSPASETTATATTTTTVTDSPAGVANAAPAPVKKKPKPRRRWRREKKVEGTKALSRFKADAVIKSQYRYRGRRLDVDPD